uniref:FZ domain-containing protein n=1 Tax=Macrostomum lignano TaxID=282301 RepID=A0A1I8II53_9PLAT
MLQLVLLSSSAGLMLTSQLLPLLVQLLLLSGWARTQDNRPPTYGVIPEVPESIRKNPENSQEQKPKIIMYWQLENRSVQAGKKTVFLCDITGLPVPDLTIDRTEPSDAGFYTCSGTNAAGTKNTTGLLEVLPARQTDRGGGGGSGGRGGGGSGGGGWRDRQPRPQRPPTEPGFCQAFKPNVCRNYLGGSRVFVTDNTYQYTMERLLVQLLAKLADAVDPSCVQPLTQAICHFNFPLCAENPASFNPDGLSASPQRLCIADCQAAVGGRCQRHFEILRTSLDYLRRGGSGDRDIFAGRSSGVV